MGGLEIIYVKSERYSESKEKPSATTQVALGLRTEDEDLGNIGIKLPL